MPRRFKVDRRSSTADLSGLQILFAVVTGCKPDKYKRQKDWNSSRLFFKI